MVQGLAFLSKKSWHTKNLANQEKVWMAEQQAAAEKSKTKELARQIQQEREQDELDRIAGKKTDRLDRGIDWMYQGGTGEAAEEDAKKAAEEFLLGKEYVAEGATKGGDFSSFDNSGINAVVSNTDASSHPKAAQGGESVVPAATVAAAAADASASAPAYDEGPSVADRNEDFRRRHEDPMFLVSQKRNEKKSQIEKKKALYSRVVGVDEPTSSRTPSKEERKRHKSSKRDRESRKDRKRDRKHHRSRRDREDYGGRKHRRSRSRSRERSSRRSDRDRQEYRDRDSYRSYRSRSRSEEHNRHGRHYRSPYSSDGDYDHKRHHSSRRDGDKASGGRHHYRDSHHHHERYRNDHRGESMIAPTRSGYGLQGASKQSSTSNSRNDRDLGPNLDLLAKKRHEKEAARRNARQKASTRRQMTDEERAEALRDMQNSASQRDEALTKAVAQKPIPAVDGQDEGPSGGKASFLNDMAQRTHGIQGDSSQLSMASRVAQKRHTNQNVNESFF